MLLQNTLTMKKIHKKFLFIIAFVFLLSPVFAYNKPLIVNFSKDTYHAGNKNWSIGQDENGVMYFGNDFGLIEFDGVEWKLCKKSDNWIIRSVAVKSHNIIFTGGYEEFGRWDRNASGNLEYTSLSKNLNKSLLKNDDFWKIWTDDNLVYFQSFNSIYIYDYKTIKRIKSNKVFLFLTKVRNEFLVQEMRGPLYKMKDGELHLIENSEIFKNSDVRVILPFGDKGYLIGTATNGMYIYDGKEFKIWNSTLSNLLRSKELNSGIITSNGYYYLGTILDGVYITNAAGEIIDHISSGNMLQNNTVLSLYEDKSKNIWTALDRGISCIRYFDNMSCYIDPSENTGAVYDASLWNGNLFIGTNQGVFYTSIDHYRNNGATLNNMKLVDGTQGQVWSFNIIDGHLYCNHNRGVKEIRKDMSVFDPFSISNLGTYKITEAKILDKDILLFSTYTSIKIWDKKSGILTTPKQISEPIRNAEVDHLSNIWLEHPNKGIYKCNLNNNLDSLYNIKLYGGETKDGLPYNLRIFKVGGRIVMLGNSTFYTYDDIGDKIIPDEQLNSCFKAIKGLVRVVHIKNNVYWAIAKTSIYKFTYDGYNAKIIESHNISINGLSLVNTFENIAILNDSINLVCLDNGFLLYNSLHQINNRIRLISPHLTAFEVRNANNQIEFKDISESVEVPSGFNNVTFHFLTEDIFTNDLSVQYMLKGIDKEWSAPQKINKMTYARLPKGKHTFLIRTTDNKGNYSEPTAYEFEILPPWYESTLAYVMYMILFVLITMLIWAMVIRHYRKLHRKKIRIWEANQLKMKNEQLQKEIEQKNAELMTQASFFIQKNELIFKLKDTIDNFFNMQSNSQIAPLSRKINVILNNNLDSEEDWKMFLIKFEQKHNGFFKKIKSMYPELTTSDLRLCACLKLNLDTKDIASLMNLSVRAIENSRYRLRKKLNIQPSQNLSDFFINID